MLFLGMIRNIGNIGSFELYNKALIGTKHLIENYVHTTVKGLQWLDEKMPDTGPQELFKKLDYFINLRHELGNTALVLSGGANLGTIFHRY